MNAQMRKPRDRDPVHVDARDQSELKMPIMDEAELLATMKGYRIALGMPQLAVDFEGDLQDGYVGKLELAIRRAIPNGALPHESWWKWMSALNLTMLLVPITGATANRTKCPCCNSALISTPRKVERPTEL